MLDLFSKKIKNYKWAHKNSKKKKNVNLSHHVLEKIVKKTLVRLSKTNVKSLTLILSCIVVLINY